MVQRGNEKEEGGEGVDLDDVELANNREAELEEDVEEAVDYDEKAVEWMMQQLCMYQTRTALISRPLAEKVPSESPHALGLVPCTRC